MERENRARGGWIPVVKQRARQLRSNSRFTDHRTSLFTLFVDNLPESMVPRKLHELFNKFGVVKDVYIPQKRRKATNTRFGFVRYDCSIAADVAEQKANGLWVDDKSLSVKVAEYNKGRVDNFRKNLQPPRYFEPLKGSSVAPNQIWKQRIDGRSFAEVIKGAEPSFPSVTTITVEETGNGWLYESMIMRLKTPYSAMQVRKELMHKEAKDILVREGGGHDVIISFNSKEEMASKSILLKAWFTDWCEYITEWRTGMHMQQERCVWITCYGVPLNLWNSNTFRKIGQLWGEVVLLNGDVCTPKSFRCGRVMIVTTVMNPINTSLNLECKGRIYPIRVLEEPISVEDGSSLADMHPNGTTKEACSIINGGLPLLAELRVDADKAVAVALSSNVEVDKAAVGVSLSQVSVVEETRDGAGFSNESGVGVVESSLPMVSQHQGQCNTQQGQCNHATQNGVEATYVCDTQQPVGGTVPGPNLSQGFLKSLSQSFIDGPGIKLEIALGQNAFGTQPFGPSSPGRKTPSFGPICATSWDISQSKIGANSSPNISSPNTQRWKKGKRKWSKREGLKHCLLAGKFSGFARRLAQSGVTSSKGRVISFKSGSKSAALPVSSPNLQQSPSRGLVQEAQSTLQMGQRLGLEFKGTESEVIRELVRMEERDKERLERGKGKVE